MISRRRLMMVATKFSGQHYDVDGNGYDVLDVGISLVGIQLSDDLDKDMDSLWLTPTIALSNDLDKDADSLSLNVGITLEAI